MADILFILSYFNQSKVVVLISVMNGLVRKVPDVIIRHICVLTPQAQSSEFNIIRKLKMSPEGTIVPGELILLT